MKSKEEIDKAHNRMFEYSPKTNQGKIARSVTLDTLLWVLEVESRFGRLLESWDRIQDRTSSDAETI